VIFRKPFSKIHFTFLQHHNLFFEVQYKTGTMQYCHHKNSKNIKRANKEKSAKVKQIILFTLC
jgi:hypothetical protein